MAFDRPTLGALIRDGEAGFRARIPGADTLLRRSNLRVTARVFAGLLHQQYGYLDWQFRQLIPDTAEDEYLQRWGRIFGIARLPATSAAGTLLVTGASGTVLPAGTRWTRPDGISFTTQADIVLFEDAGTAAIIADTPGAESNFPAGTGLTLVSAMAGITGTATIGTGGTTGGTAEESEDALRARLLARIRQPPQGGAEHDYVAWAMSVPGVTRAFVFPQRRGPGTVDVSFTMDGRANIIPLADDIEAVQAVIDQMRPVTADSLVFAPTPSAQPITIVDLAGDTPAIRAAVLVELQALFARDASPGCTLYRSRISEAISAAAGENSHTLIEPATDVTFAATVIPVLGTVTFA